MKCSICGSEEHFRAKCTQGGGAHRTFFVPAEPAPPPSPGPLDGLLGDVDTVQTFMINDASETAPVEDLARPADLDHARHDLDRDPWSRGRDPWSQAGDWTRLRPESLPPTNIGARLWDPYIPTSREDWRTAPVTLPSVAGSQSSFTSNNDRSGVSTQQDEPYVPVPPSNALTAEEQWIDDQEQRRLTGQWHPS